MRTASSQLHSFLDAHDEERARSLEDVQALKVHISSIHHIERAASGKSWSRMLTSWIFPSETSINVGIEPAGCASSLPPCGSENAPTGTDPISRDRWWWNRGRRRRRRDRSPRVRRRKADERRRSAFARSRRHAPVVRLVGVSQGGTRDFAAKPDVVELGLDRAQTDFDVAQAFAIGVARKPRRETDPNRRNRADDDRRDSVRRTCGTHTGR